MALRNQPYIPLYIQDFLTDEKLSECSAESTGVYIRLMCLMHKSEEYGTVLLKQKDKQTGKQISDFAIKLARQMPYDTETITRSLAELLDEDVISIDGDTLFQKRMVRDGKLSDTRASAGSKGGKKKANQEFASQFAKGVATDFALAKPVANAESESEIEIENENENENDIDIESVGDDEKRKSLSRAHMSKQEERFDEFWTAYPKKAGKGVARKAWMKIKPTAALFEKIILAVEAAKQTDQWRRENGRFIPNPTTWLNQERWDDDPEENQGSPRTAMDDLRELHELFAKEEDG